MSAFDSQVACGSANDLPTLLSPARLYISSGRTSPTSAHSGPGSRKVAAHCTQRRMVLEEQPAGRGYVSHSRMHGPAFREQPAHEVVAVLPGGAE